MRFSKSKKDITILAPSKELQDLSGSFPGMQIVNPVQIIVKHEEMHYAFCKSINEVHTEFFYIYDNDDTLPELPETFPDVGIIFGDIWVSYHGETKSYPLTQWTIDKHFYIPQFVHRAICRTEDARRILKDVSHLPILTEWWLYFHLAKDCSFHYDPSIIMKWDRKDTGLHTKSQDVLKNTRDLFDLTYPEFITKSHAK